ncbi:MAG TPA: LysR family transcriptional regulator [Polyangiaceae bacterium]|nr:LysR family transcriptional regulator [Polyangiaceae bacterium]
MDFNDVPLFVRIVDTGSFSTAAAELGMQRSSVSRAMARLEQGLGVRLLQRTTRKLALTDAGQAFYERVRGAVSGIDEALDAAREFGPEPRGTVRLTTPPDSSHFGLADAIREFTEKYPSIRVELLLTGRTVDLVAEGVDIAIRAGRLADSSLIARRVGGTPLALFAAPKYLERAGVPQTLDDLKRHECVLFRTRGPKATWHFSGPNGDESVEVQGQLSADDMAFILRLCMAGAGVAFIPTMLAREPAIAGAIQLVLPQYGLSRDSVYVVLPSAAFVPARVALLRDHLVRHLQREIAQTEKDCTAHEARRGRAPSRRTPARGAPREPKRQRSR